MPTGGVLPDLDNLKEWFDAGVVCVGMGSKLISPQILKEKAYDQLEKRIRQSLENIKSLKVRN
jgi:2-dehydro-3-deoxyphosphogluconate aldolase/(4S)-4-hydroxy-2-oxoglutarate aldolase